MKRQRIDPDQLDLFADRTPREHLEEARQILREKRDAARQ